MNILFDQGTPVPLRRYLDGHRVVTAYEAGWSWLQNGQLLEAAEREGYDLFITTDQNLQYQQNLSRRRLAILVLSTTSCRVFANTLMSFGLRLLESRQARIRKYRFLNVPDTIGLSSV